MKTIKIKFPLSKAEEVAKICYSLDLVLLLNWSVETWSGDYVYCIYKLTEENGKGLDYQLQIEKLREKNFITIIK